MDSEKYENDIIEIDDLEGTDVKINPDYYIHKAIEATTTALLKDNLKDGLIQYRLLIEQIELMVGASKMIDKEYEEALEQFKQTPEYVDEKDAFTKGVKLAQKKFKLILEAIFSHKIATEPLKL